MGNFNYISQGPPTTSAPTPASLLVDVVNGALWVGYNGQFKPAGGGVASVNLTGQIAAIAATTLFTPTYSGVYQLDWMAKVTVVDATSSTLGALTITYKDTDGVAQSQVAGAFTQAGAAATTNAGNATTSNLNGNMTINAIAGTAIQYAMAYASNVAGTMTYELKMRLVFEG